jgi:hypothetical protein
MFNVSCQFYSHAALQSESTLLLQDRPSAGTLFSQNKVKEDKRLCRTKSRDEVFWIERQCCLHALSSRSHSRSLGF